MIISIADFMRLCPGRYSARRPRPGKPERWVYSSEVDYPFMDNPPSQNVKLEIFFPHLTRLWEDL